VEIRPEAERLSAAASLLDAVAADRDHVAAEVALDCMFAAEQLELSGARLAVDNVPDGDPRTLLRIAMNELAALDDEVLSRPSVIAAARAARHAFRRLA
jgi:hypothetical protein